MLLYVCNCSTQDRGEGSGVQNCPELHRESEASEEWLSALLPPPHPQRMACSGREFSWLHFLSLLTLVLKGVSGSVHVHFESPWKVRAEPAVVFLFRTITSVHFCTSELEYSCVWWWLRCGCPWSLSYFFILAVFHSCSCKGKQIKTTTPCSISL